MQTISIGEGTTTIGKYAFYSCESLTDIYLPSTLTSLGKAASEYSNDNPGSIFGDCPQLQAIHMDKGESPAAKLIDGVLFSNDGTQLICYPPKLPMSKTHGNYIVPQSVTTIYQYAFNFNALSHVVLPNDLKSIDRYAFLDDQNRPTATHVTEITLPASVTYLPQLWNAGSHIQTIVYCEKKPMDT